MPTGTPRPQQWLLRLLMGVQACRLPALKPLKPLKPPDPSFLLSAVHANLPFASLSTPRPASGMPNRAGISYPKARSIVSSQRGPCQPAVCQPLNPKAMKLCHSVWDAQPRSLKPLKLCPSVWDAQPRRHKLPQGQIHRFFSARSMPTGTPRQQWLLRLLMGVQACRLPALKPLKPLKPLQLFETLPQRMGRPIAQL